MSQPVVFEMEGQCSDGQMIVVKGWPDLGCQDVPKTTQKVIKQTTIQKVDPTPMLWLLAAMVLVSVAVVGLAHLMRRDD